MTYSLRTILVELRTRMQLRELGYKRSEVRRLVGKIDEPLIDRAAVLAGQAVVAELASAPKATNDDHPFLDWLTKFLNSDLGKALIAALIALLLAL